MVAHWMRVGFVHGVMNTDNMSILGLTIDYGPYGWIDNFDLDWTPNTTDAQGRRYRFGQQPQIAYWNLGRLANALAPVFASIEPLQAGLQRYVDDVTIASRSRATSRRSSASPNASTRTSTLHADAARAAAAAEVDMTLFFRALADVDLDAPDAGAASRRVLRRRRSSAMRSRAFNDWLARYARAGAQRRRCRPPSGARACTPPTRATCCATISRSRRSTAPSRATTRASHELLDVMRRPYDDQPGARAPTRERRPDWARNRAGLLDAVVQLVITCDVLLEREKRTSRVNSPDSQLPTPKLDRFGSWRLGIGS